MPVAPAEVSWTIRQGRTFRYVVRPEKLPIVYKPITGIAQVAPVSITVPGHGLVTEWNAAVTNVKGMTQLNAVANALKATDFRPVTVVDTDTITFNSIDASGFSPYVSGGYLVYYTPANLAGAVARLDLRDKVGGTLLYTMSNTIGNIILDDVNHFIGIEIPAVDSAAFTFRSAVGDLEVQYADGTVEQLLDIEVEVDTEVTTSG